MTIGDTARGTQSAAKPPALAGLLRGDLDPAQDALVRAAIPAAWHARPAQLAAFGQHELTYARIREAHRNLPRVSELLADPWACCAVLERAAVVDPRLFHPLLLHYTLTTAPVLRFGGPRRTAGLVGTLESMAAMGCAAMTEIGRAHV